ncbi:MAG TPA: alpha/beta hydrolase [Methanobacterium sp.]|nr:alpha/beta hydrolase [Methanobacterium sp.]
MNIKKSPLEVDGINITFYESFPVESETPLFLLHGGGLDSAMLSYGSTIADLGKKFHVIVPDLPGYGDSDKPDVPYTLEWYQEFLDQLILALNYDKIDLGGLSLGGGIALGYALKNPEKVRNLVLIAPYGLTDKIPYPKITSWLIKHSHIYDSLINLILSNKMLLKANLKRLMVNPEALTEDLLDQVRLTGNDPDNRRAWNVFQLSEIKDSKLRTSYIDELNKLTMPVLLLTGKNDSLVPSKDVEKAHELIPQSKLVELDDCGHWLPRDRSSEFIQVLKNFLK